MTKSLAAETSKTVLLDKHDVVCKDTTARRKNDQKKNNNNENLNDATLSSPLSLWDTVLDYMQGDFDNYVQVVHDRVAGLTPGAGGGHEHIHATLVPVSDDARLAAYYLDGMPFQLFRFRYYHFVPVFGVDNKDDDEDVESDEDDDSLHRKVVAVDTVLYTLHPTLESQLRAVANDPWKWPALYHAFVAQQEQQQQPSVQPARQDSAGDSPAETTATTPHLTLLPNCDVRWTWEPDPVQHAYLWDQQTYEHSEISGIALPASPAAVAATTTTAAAGTAGLHAVMVHGEALVNSTRVPGQQILIRDQLSLWRDALWIHDRGLDPQSVLDASVGMGTERYIYGNQRGIPYKMDRVARFVVNDQDNSNTATNNIEKNNAPRPDSVPLPLLLQRDVTNPSLQWTLGPAYRTDVEYQDKMAALSTTI